MSYPMIADGGPDDLPRTLRRERDAREREAREREAAERAQAEREQLAMGTGTGPAGMAPSAIGPVPITSPARMADPDGMYAVPHGYPSGLEAAMPAVVTRYDVPFLHLVAFFFKVALAAIPALLFIGALVWGAGHLLQIYFPWLVKAQILIHFPN